MFRRVSKLLAIVTPLAVFASLQFSGPRGEPISSVLDPLLPAKAEASCVDNHICLWNGNNYLCQSWQYTACHLNPGGTNCWQSETCF